MAHINPNQPTELDLLLASLPVTPRPPIPKINVKEFKQKVAECSESLNRIERGLNYLQAMHKSFSDQDWKIKVQQMVEIKEKMIELHKEVGNPIVTKKMVAAVRKQKKKRAQRKLKKMEHQERVKMLKEYRAEENSRIDDWLLKKKDEVEAARAAEQVKNEADSVLGDVVKKKSGAKRYMNFFNTLNKLRGARTNERENTGNPVPSDQSESFPNISDGLTSFWVDELNDYKLEEYGLKVMLSDSQPENVDLEQKQQRSNLQAWRSVFFGNYSGTYPPNSVPTSVPELIKIRKQWDQFICEDEDATPIPLGWVIPVKPSSGDWSTYLEN